MYPCKVGASSVLQETLQIETGISVVLQATLNTLVLYEVQEPQVADLLHLCQPLLQLHLLGVVEACSESL